MKARRVCSPRWRCRRSSPAAARLPAPKDDAAKKAATPAATAAAKPDIATAGDVTLTVWDQEVRGGQNAADRSSSTSSSRRSTRTSRSSASRSPSRTCSKTVKLAVSGAERARRRRGQPGPRRSWASSSRPGCCARSTTTPRSTAGTTRYSPTAAGPEQVLVRRQASSAPATCTASPRWARSSASTTTRTKVADAADDARPSSRPRCRRPRTRARRRSMFGNLEKWPGHPRLRERARADRRQAGDPRLRLRRRTAPRSTHPQFHGRRRRRSRSGSTRATSTRTSTAPTTTRRGRTSPRARGRS